MVILLVCSFEQQNSNKNVKSPFYLRNNWGLLSQYRYVISAAKINIFPLQTTLIDTLILLLQMVTNCYLLRLSQHLHLYLIYH